MPSLDLNTVLLAALISIVSWLGKRTLNQLDAMVWHLATLNRRTEKLEARMAVEEARNK